MTEFRKTTKRVLAKRGVLWLGQTCNFHCQFCYFLDRIKSRDHPEHPFMSLSKAKKICRTLVDFYGNTSIDIQGGEPTIYPEIHELVSYCREIGLLPTLITNAMVLSKKDACIKLKEAGVRDLLISVHGLRDAFDTIVGVKGAHEKQMVALKNLAEVGIPFRFNCVLSKTALPQLSEIARLAVESGARVVNFIAFNPFEDQQKLGMRSVDNVPTYSEVSGYLMAAMDILEQGDVECNVRYFPLCMVEERYRKSIYNFQQLPFDIHEWDYASWSWTGLQSQRMKDGDTSEPIPFEDAVYEPITYPGRLQQLALKVRESIATHPRLLKAAIALNRGISRSVNGSTGHSGTESLEELYRANAKVRAKCHCCYVYADKCSCCSLQEICDGFHGDYAALFTAQEARPVMLPEKINDPKYYISLQEKVVEEEEYGWAL
ncbi:radical SAM protein [Geobacter pelophilus]|uniref:Radical SAM protein n=1 Tax=Geoanaerobacter pelophilus TaxID=60036 RepID=A0AAW4L7I3_9BACT|nr:radical SAM protein [Geoanaerobacter pelophilus]MBT0664540.1 radical SAM protein [Geoanaerobacter pelophilus]